MPNVLEFYVSMKDKMSGALVKMASTAKASFKSIQTDYSKAIEKGQVMNKSVSELRHELKEVNKVRFGTVLSSEFKSATVQAKNLEREISKIRNTGGTGINKSRGFGLLNGLGGLGRYAVGGLSLTALLGLGTTSVNAAMDFHSKQKTFEVLTGSPSVGKRLANNLFNLKQNTVLGASVYGNAQTLMGYGVHEKEILKDLRMIGDVSTGNIERFQNLTLAYAQVRAQGRLTGQEMRQLVNAGFNPLNEISRTSGKTMSQLQKELREGSISADLVTKAFESATSEGGRFNNMLNQVADTSYGKAQLLKSQWAAFKIDLGDSLMPVADKLIFAAGELLKVFKAGHASQSETMMKDKEAATSLLQTAANLKEGGVIRRGLLNDAISKYPDLFKHLDIEKASNRDLLNTLKEINSEYSRKIVLTSGDENLKMLTSRVGKGNQFITDLQKKIALANNGHLSEAVKDYGFFERHGTFSNKNKAIARWQQMIQTESQVLNGTQYQLGGGPIGRFFGEERIDYNGLLSRQRPIQKSNEFKDAIVSAYNLVHSKDKLTDLFGSDKTALSNFVKVASKITLNNGVYSTHGGGVAYAKKLTSLMDYMPKTPDSTASGGGEGLSDNVGRGIASGGPRTININGPIKFIETLIMQPLTADKGFDEMEPKLKEMYLRILNNGAKVQG